MPYNQASEPETKNRRANGVHASSAPNGLRNEALGRPADAEVAQGSERSVYTREVAGSNPAFRTIPLTRGYVALVDPQDYERFGHLKWTAGAFGRRTGYAYRSEWVGEKCHSILLHRAILGAAPGQIVDHINGDTFDNRRANLRLVTAAQNAFNARRKPSKHGFVGVDSQTVGVYRGRVFIGGKSHYTKSFSSPVLAAAARDVLAQQLHGEYAVLNFRFTPASALRPGA